MANEYRKILEQLSGHKALLQKLDDVLLTTAVIEKDTNLSKYPKRRDVLLFLYSPRGLGVWSPLHQTDILALGTLSADVFGNVIEERLTDAGFSQVSLEVSPRKATKATVIATFGPSRVRIVYRQVPASEQSSTDLFKSGNAPLVNQLQSCYVNEKLSASERQEIAKWFDSSGIADTWLNMESESKNSSNGEYDHAILLEFGAPATTEHPPEAIQKVLENLVSYDADPKWKSRPWPRLLRYVAEDNEAFPVRFAYILALCKKNYCTSQTQNLLTQWQTKLQNTTKGFYGVDADTLPQAQIRIVDSENLPTFTQVTGEEPQPQQSPKSKTETETETQTPPTSISPGNQKNKVKLRPATDVYNRIKWDSKFDITDYLIGYLDRFEGIKEVPMEEWIELVEEEYFVPMHRIRYFKRIGDGVIVWDRDKRLDRIF